MNFIKANWKQGLTAVCSVGVAALLLTHKITPAMAVGIGTALAAFGLHLEPVDYAGSDK